MSTTSVGREAEELVAEYLKTQGHKIVSMNWRTRWCEIDIVSKTKSCIYFTEVKYRSNNDWGEGFSYVTNSKLSQMKFAAEMWLNENKWSDDCLLQAAQVNNKQGIEIVELY